MSLTFHALCGQVWLSVPDPSFERLGLSGSPLVQRKEETYPRSFSKEVANRGQGPRILTQGGAGWGGGKAVLAQESERWAVTHEAQRRCCLSRCP